MHKVSLKRYVRGGELSWPQALVPGQTIEDLQRLGAREHGRRPSTTQQLENSFSRAEKGRVQSTRPESWADVRDGPIMDRLEDYAPEPSAGQRRQCPSMIVIPTMYYFEDL